MKPFLKTICYIVCIVAVMKMTTLPALGLENGYSRVVYNVSGLQNYSLHWNDRFPPDSKLMIYTESNGVNHRRLIGVDYIFIIRDPNNNIVDTEVLESKYKNYKANDFVVFNRTVTEEWDDGYYTTQIHIYDLLNDSIVEEYYNNVTATLVNETDENETLPDIPYMKRGDIVNDSILNAVQHKIVIQKFWVDRYTDKYPANRFIIKDITLDKMKVAPGENISIFANIENNFYDNGTATFDILMDKKKIDNISISMENFSTKQVNFNVSSNILGIHEIEIMPTSKDTIIHDSFIYVDVTDQEVKTSTTFNYKDIMIDNLTVEPNQTVVVTITIENKGKAGLLPVTLNINNVPDTQQDVYLNFLETRDVKFNITKTEIGQYKVTVNGTDLSKIFFVREKREVVGEKKEQIEEKKTPKIYVISGILVAIILVFALRRYLVNRWR